MTINNFTSQFASFSLAFFTTLLLPANNAEAVGLGRLTVYSTQGRPLMAEVELTDAPVNDRPLMECFRLGSEGNSASSAPLITQGRVTLEQSGGRYRLHISSEQPVNDAQVQLSLRKGCGAEVTRNYLIAIPAARTRHSIDTDRSLSLPRARQSAGQMEEGERRTVTREWRLGHKTTARELARKRHPGRPAAQERYLRALQAANPDIDLGSRGQNRLPAGTWLSIPSSRSRPSNQSTLAVPHPHSRSESAAIKTPGAPKVADRVIVSSGRPADENAAARAQSSTPATDKAGSATRPTIDEEARLLAAVDLQNEQQRLLSEKIRLLDERIQELQKTAMPANPANSPGPAATPAAAAIAPAVLPTTALPAAPATGATSVSSPTELPAASAARPRPTIRKTNSFWNDWGYELLFGALALAIGALWLLRSRARRSLPAPATQPISTEIPNEASPETASRWQLVGQSENLSVFDRAPIATAKDGGAAADSKAPPDELDEMTAVLELAEIMVSFGRFTGAAQAIEEFIEKHPRSAVAPWLKLLEIYRQNGQREAFDALGIRLRQHFNVAPADWDHMDENSLAPFSPSDAHAIPIEQLLARLPTLGQLPHIQAEISRTWATPACAAYIDRLLRDNRNGERRGFLLGTVRELLLISDVLDSQLKKS